MLQPDHDEVHPDGPAGLFGLTARGLQPQQYAALKAVAKSQGNDYTTSSYTSPNAATYPNTVLYFKVPRVTR